MTPEAVTCTGTIARRTPGDQAGPARHHYFHTPNLNPTTNRLISNYVLRPSGTTSSGHADVCVPGPVPASHERDRDPALSRSVPMPVPAAQCGPLLRHSDRRSTVATMLDPILEKLKPTLETFSLYDFFLKFSSGIKAAWQPTRGAAPSFDHFQVVCHRFCWPLIFFW